MTSENKADKLIGLGTPDPKKPPETIRELLDEKVRGALNTELALIEQREQETSVVLYVGADGVPVMDNSPEMEVLDWIMTNAKRRGIQPTYPKTKKEGD